MAYQPSQELQDKLSKAKARLTLSQPFFAATLLRKKITWDENCPTMAVDARGNIYLGPKFVESLNVQQLIFGLAHECMHYMLLHPTRRGARKMMPWNIACDATINDMLREANVGEDIPKTVNVPGARNMSAEQLYQENEEKGGGGDGHGEPGGLGQDLREEGMSDAEIRELEAQAQADMVQARNIAKMAGKMPGNIDRLVDEILYVPTPWYQILERFMTSMVNDGQSWSRPNRKHIPQNIYLPGKHKQPGMGTVVVAVDTSGSIGGPELAEFQGHFNAILEQCRPEKVVVVYCDAAVGSHEEFEEDDMPAHFTKVTGGGGTDFAPVFEWVEENGIEPEVVVYLTDGLGPCRTDTPGYPVVWLTTGATEFPFGEVVEFKNK